MVVINILIYFIFSKIIIMEKIFEKINKLIDIKQYHVFINNKNIVSAKTLKNLKEKIKDFENPKKDIKCYIIRISIKPNYIYPLTINCSQYTITPNLTLMYDDNDMSQSFTYTEKELLEYSFKLSHIKKIIKAMKKDLVSFEKSTDTITNVFNALD